MLKKTMTFKDYDGLDRTEDFYFNLSQAEVLEMEMGITGGLAEMIKKIISTSDVPKIVAVFKDLIVKSYGERDPNGKRFIKSPELTLAFCQTEAYSDLFMELSTQDEKAAEFVNGIIPAPKQESSHMSVAPAAQ